MKQEAQQKQIDSDAGRVTYWTIGEGRPLVLLHGATIDHRLWDGQLDPLAAEFRLIVPDLPGHGLSRPYSDFSLKACADEVARIMDEEAVSKAGFVGQSMGGYIAQVFAAEHPGRVQAFLAVDTSPFSGAYYSALDRWLLSVTPALLKLYPYNYLVRTIARSIAVDEAAQASALSALQMLTKSEIADIMQAVYTGLLQYAERDLQMSVPTLIVYGEKDRSGKVISYSKRWAAEEGHELDVIPNAAHNSNADNPDYFNRIATDFFTRHM